MVNDHDKIEEQCSALLRAVRRGASQRAQASTSLLILAVTLADHLGVEDEVVDLTAEALARGYRHAEAFAMRRDLDRLRQNWSDFLQAHLHEPLADWETFAGSLSALLVKLLDRVSQENKIVYKHAASIGVISMRDHRTEAS